MRCRRVGSSSLRLIKHIEIDSVSIARVHPYAKEGELYLYLSVPDIGRRGWTPRRRGASFEPFYVTKEMGKGTGLGLARSNTAWSEQHEGFIQLIQ